MNDEEKTRADKIRETVELKYQSGYTNPMTGKQQSDETRARISESGKGKHSGPRKKRTPLVTKVVDICDKAWSETPPKYGMKTESTSKLPTNSPIEVIQTTEKIQPVEPLPIHSFSHRIRCVKEPFYIGFSADPYDTSSMSESWHRVADGNEIITEILDRDCSEKEIRELSKFYLETEKPVVNVLEAKLSLLSAHDLRLLELPEDGGEYSVPYGVDEDEVPTDSYINGLGYTVEPPGTEQHVPTETKTGTHVDNDGNEMDTWVDTEPQNQPKQKKVEPVIDTERQLKLLRDVAKRVMDTKEEIDDNADYSGRETILT